MKNYWLARRKSRSLERFIQIVESAVKKKLWINALKGGMPWQKNATKTQP
jgi:hypothetical protein